MDTKQKNREDARRTRRPAPADSRQAQQRAEEARRRAMDQLPVQAPRSEGPLPQEEVYRPTPTQERHSQEVRQMPQEQKEAPRRRSTKKRRPFGRSAARRQTMAEGKRKVSAPKKNAPAVIYTKPLPFNLNRLLIQLLTVAALVLTFTLGLSIFFKVEHVTVSGASIYSEWDVKQASGIEGGDALLSFSRARAGAKIQSALPYVDSIRFGIKLPNTVIIDITEIDVTYAIQATDGLWWFITSEGRVVGQTDEGTASKFTKITGVRIELPEPNTVAVAWEQLVATDPSQPGGDPTDETDHPVTVTNADRLDVALRIVRAMEANDVVGEVAKVDGSDLGDIKLAYGTRYEVRVGNTDDLEFKIAAMESAVSQMSDYQRGVLDVTFVIWPDKVVFTPSED